MDRFLRYFTVFEEKVESFTINIDKVLFIVILGSAVNSMVDAINAALNANPNLANSVLQPLTDILNDLTNILNLLNNPSGRDDRNTGKIGGGPCLCYLFFTYFCLIK